MMRLGIVVVNLMLSGCAFGMVPTSEGEKTFFWFVGSKVETKDLKASSPADIPTLINVGVQSVGTD